jgi:hypothetical protein
LIARPQELPIARAHDVEICRKAIPEVMIVLIVDGGGEAILIYLPKSAPISAFRNAGRKTAEHVTRVAGQTKNSGACTLMRNVSHAKCVARSGSTVIPIPDCISAVRIS